MGLEEFARRSLPRPDQADDARVVVAATVVSTPTAGADLRVIVPRFSGEHIYEIARWWGAPAAGDEVLVAFDDSDEPWFVAPDGAGEVTTGGGGGGVGGLDGTLNEDGSIGVTLTQFGITSGGTPYFGDVDPGDEAYLSYTAGHFILTKGA